MNADNRPEPFWTRLAERLYSLGTAGFMLIVIGVVVISIATMNSPGSPDRVRPDEEAQSAVFPLPARSLSVSSDGQFVDVIRGDSTWRRHDAHTGRELSVRKIECPSPVQSAMRSDGEVVVQTVSGCRLQIQHPFETLTLEELPHAQPREHVSRCAVARHKDLVAVISDEGSLWLLEFNDERIHSVRHESIGTRLGHVAVSPDGQLVALVKGARLLIWDVQRRQIVNQQHQETDDSHFVQWSDDGTTLITYGIHSQIGVWDAQSLTLRRQFTAAAHTVTTAAISPAGRFAAVADGDVIRVWEVESGQEIVSLSGHQAAISALHFAEEDRTLFSADLHGELRRWSLIDGREIWSVP